jgi:hypothetical protein
MTLRGERGAQAVSYSVGETRSRKWLERPSIQFVRGITAAKPHVVRMYTPRPQAAGRGALGGPVGQVIAANCHLGKGIVTNQVPEIHSISTSQFFRQIHSKAIDLRKTGNY